MTFGSIIWSRKEGLYILTITGVPKCFGNCMNRNEFIWSGIISPVLCLILSWGNLRRDQLKYQIHLGAIKHQMKSTSWRKSATPLRGGNRNPNDSKNSITSAWGPWYTTYPSESNTRSSNNSKVSGAGWRRAIINVASIKWTKFLKHLTIWYVVELSSPVDISSMKSVFLGPTIISPVYGNHY